MVGLALIEALESADKQATLFLNGLHSEVTDPFWIMMSDKIVWVPLYAIAVFFLFKHLGWK
jgi:undecaprenyl-diphosphatase